jgi:hypothetical protein
MFFLMFLIMCLFAFADPTVEAQETDDFSVYPFGENGQLKMVYDLRQRPQAVWLNEEIHIVFNADGDEGATGRSRTKPQAVTYDLNTRQFSDTVTLGGESSDHHNGPVLWIDSDEYLHTFFGFHHDIGTHLISNNPGQIGTSLNDWTTVPHDYIMSYPFMSRVYDDQQLVYYRTDGHISSWTYRISADEGQTWTGPAEDVTDLDMDGTLEGALDWSSYHAKAPSKDGNFLHVAFIAYDDNKTEPTGGGRLYNPLYGKKVGYKYNLYYVKIDLRTDEVMNQMGKILQTPIDRFQADDKAMIWDTQWRGGDSVPSILLDENDQASFLHVLSDEVLSDEVLSDEVLSDETPEDLGYYYVKFDNGEWINTRITDSNHEWNSSYLDRSADGILHGYLITGDEYFDSEDYLSKHGGGNIEEWISANEGSTWTKARDLTPDPMEYPGMIYNNIQPILKPDGTRVDDMLLFYGWENDSLSTVKSFLLVDNKQTSNPSPANDSYALPSTLSWDELPVAVSYIIYYSQLLSDIESDLNPNATLTPELSGLTLEAGAEYYWRVDAVTDAGLVHEGDVWTFTDPTVIGDFDRDGDVDGFDFLEWQRGLGTIYNADDLAHWEANYGAGTLQTTSSTAVPEPATGIMLLIGMINLLFHRDVIES